MSGPDGLRVSLVLTVKDEASSLQSLLESIAGQTRPPDEIIVVDGGSSDDTVERLRCWSDRLPLTIVEAPGTTISQGRNIALARASGEVVAVTDGGVWLDPRWLEEMVAPFSRPLDQQPDVVAGFFRADSKTWFEAVLAATTLPDEEEIDPARFLPSSRSVAFRHSWYAAGIQYPEWLDYCEDLIFDLRLRRTGARFEFRPSAFVWFRPRRGPVAFWHQYFRYARGDGKAGLFARRHAARYATYLVFLPAVVVARKRGLYLLAGLGAVGYMRRPWARLWRRGLRWGELIAGVALAPFLRLLGDVAKMAGYPVGLLWRARRYGLTRSWRTIPELAQSGARRELIEQREPEELRRP